jgi:N-acetylglutamate synthase-like GNAT family acetyltransferase
MAQVFPLPSNCVLRPAVRQDKWQIYRLMRYFQKEVRSPFSRTMQVAGCFITGILIVFFIQLILIVGLKAFYGLLAFLWLLVCCQFLVIALSREWENFWVVEYSDRLIACAKLSPYATYSVLYNVIVHPAARQQGLGSALVSHVAQVAMKPLYLACVQDKVRFYQRFGFIELRSPEVPPLIRYDLGLSPQRQIVPMMLK